MSPGFLPVATLDGARAAPVGATRLVARAMEMFDALRSAAPARHRRHSIALCGIARAGIAPRAHTQCCRGNGAEQSTWPLPASLAGVDLVVASCGLGDEAA